MRFYTPAEIKGRWTQMLGAIELAVIVGLIGLALMLACPGCKSYPTSAPTKPQDQINAAGEQANAVAEPLVRAEVRREIIITAVKRATSAASGQPLVIEPLAVAKVQGEAQGDDLKESKNAVVSLKADLIRADKAAGAAAGRYEALRGEWYVTWGLRIEAAGWWLLGIGGVFLVGSIVKDTALASGWGIVFVWAYKAIIGLISGGLYFVGLFGRSLVKRWKP